MKDLIVLVADLDTQNVLLGLFPRLPRASETTEFAFDIKRHPQRDGGCATGSADFLRAYSTSYQHALVIFDRAGCGMERFTRETIESKVESELLKNGWAEGSVAVIVIDPEVENWIWVNTPKVSEVLSWSGEKSLYTWLEENGWLVENAEKPHPPKEAMEAVLKQNKRKPVAYMFKEIADSVSYRRCTDPAFLKMLAMLKVWFSPPNPDEL